MVDISKTVGKALKSIGRSMKMTVIKIKTDTLIEIESEMSNSQVGIGKIKMKMIKAIPSANSKSFFTNNPGIFVNVSVEKIAFAVVSTDEIKFLKKSFIFH